MTDQSLTPAARIGLPPIIWIQIAMLVTLAVGGVFGLPLLSHAAAAFAVVASLMQWARLLPLARVFGVLALLSGLGVALFLPQGLPQMVQALVQGVGFCGLMMVLGLLRQPVKRAAITRNAAEYLLAFQPRARFGALLTGAHFMSLMFNIGIIAMIGDLIQPRDGSEGRNDPARRAMVLAAMRGTALMTVWSPIGLGFAIVTSSIPGVDAMRLMGYALVFAAVALPLAARFPMLPAEARVAADAPPVVARGAGSPRAVAATVLVSGLLLALTIGLHSALEISFTLASVLLLPVFSFVWLALESRDEHGALGGRIRQSLKGMADLRSESVIFMSANVIGAGLSLAVQASPLWSVVEQGGLPGWPVLMAVLVVVPLVAMLYLPHSIVIVMVAQLLGPTPIGTEHPMALGLTLVIVWATAIAVSHISAMTLISGSFCAAPSRQVARSWNLPFLCLLTGLAVVAISLVYLAGV